MPTADDDCTNCGHASKKHSTFPEDRVCCEVDGCECTYYSDPFWDDPEETP